MSKTAREIEDAFTLRADFDDALSQRNEEQCRAMIDAMGEKGEELEAMRMHREANRVFNPEPKDPYEAEQDRGVEHDNHVHATADIW